MDVYSRLWIGRRVRIVSGRIRSRREERNMRWLALLVALLAVGGVADTTALGHPGTPFKTPAAIENFFLHGTRGGVFLQKGNAHYGPVVAAACRGEGTWKSTAGGRAYQHAICATRVPNAVRLLMLRYHTNGDFEILGFR
jgi:hypothetical protein